MKPRPLRRVVDCTDGAHALLLRKMPVEVWVSPADNDNSYLAPVA